MTAPTERDYPYPYLQSAVRCFGGLVRQVMWFPSQALGIRGPTSDPRHFVVVRPSYFGPDKHSRS